MTSRDLTKLRTRVQTALRGQGRTQKQLEQDLGWPPAMISRVFSGKRGLDDAELDAFAAAVGVPRAELAVAALGPTPKRKPAPVEAPSAADPAGVGPAPAVADPAPAPAAVPAPAAEGVEAPTIPSPVAAAALASEPARSGTAERPEPKAAPPPPADFPKSRLRKRDLPFRALRWLVETVLG